MEIRFAMPQDVPGILSLLRQVGEVHHQGRPDIFRVGAQKYGASQVLHMLDDTNTPIFVACDGQTVLGYCFCIFKTHCQDPVLCDHTTLYIDDLCVDAGCRGQKVGSGLYYAACDLAREKGCHSVTLNVWACNEPAVKFYEALGMKPQKIGMETLLEEA